MYEMEFLKKNIPWEIVHLPKEKRLLVVSGSTRENQKYKRKEGEKFRLIL